MKKQPAFRTLKQSDHSFNLEHAIWPIRKMFSSTMHGNRCVPFLIILARETYWALRLVRGREYCSCKFKSPSDKRIPKPGRGCIGARLLTNPGDIWKENAWYSENMLYRFDKEMLLTLFVLFFFFFVFIGIMYSGVRNKSSWLKKNGSWTLQLIYKKKKHPSMRKEQARFGIHSMKCMKISSSRSATGFL